MSNQPMETILSYAHPLSNALLPKIVLWPLVCVLIIRLVVLYSPFYSFSYLIMMMMMMIIIIIIILIIIII